MLRQIARMAGPLVVAQISVAAMTFIDTLLMGQLGIEVLAGGGLGSVIYQFVYIVGIGVLVASANMIAFANGQGATEVIKQSMLSGSVIVVVLSVIAITSLQFIEPLLILSGQQAEISQYAQSYLSTVSWSLIPAFGFILLRSLVTGHGDTGIILPISLGAALLNFPVSYVLMHGMFGLPALGLNGIALGTCFIALLMFISLCFATYRQQRYQAYAFWNAWERFSFAQFVDTIRLGVPIALAHAMEIGLFSAAAILIGWLGVVELAAHQIALQGTALSFMVPLAISQAVSVKVGELYGSRQIDLIPVAVKAGVKLAFVWALIAACIFCLAPEMLVSIFVEQSSEGEYQRILLIASQILVIAALFQLVDGWQVIFMGALRGFKLGASPTVAAIVSYWVVGFPISLYALEQYEAVGVWSGMGIGLAFSAFALALLLKRRLDIESSRHL